MFRIKTIMFVMRTIFNKRLNLIYSKMQKYLNKYKKEIYISKKKS